MSRLRIHGIPDSRAFRSLLGADFTVADLNLAAVKLPRAEATVVPVGDAAAQRIAIGWIMISGPFRSGAAGAASRAANLQAMNEAALALFRGGHVPIIGVNLALPMIAAAGDDAYDEIMMPLSLAAAERCDACLRIGGPSAGAEEEVARFRARSKPVYFDLADVLDKRGSADGH
jgi:hypothetical protein